MVGLVFALAGNANALKIRVIPIEYSVLIG